MATNPLTPTGEGAMKIHLFHRLIFKLIDPSKFFLLILRILFHLFGYPRCCNQAYIEQHIDLPIKEIQLYSSFTRRASRSVICLVAIFTFYAIKNIFYLYFTLSRVNFRQPTLNIHEVNETWHQFVCLETNCTTGLVDFGAENFSLAYDSLNLPIFSICHQHFKHLFSPFIGSQTIGLLYMTEYTFVVVVLCVAYPIYINLLPTTENWTLMFGLCPILRGRIVRDDIRNHLVTLCQAQVNYKKKTGRPGSHAALNRLKRLEQVDDLDDELQEYIEDCVPINRTEWWRRSLLRAFVVLFILQLLSWFHILGVGAGLFVWLSTKADLGQAYMQLTFANQTDCVLRYSQSHTNLEEQHIRLDWNFYSTLEFLATLLIPCYIIAFFMTNYFLVCKDEKISILELREQLQVAVNFRLILGNSGASRRLGFKVTAAGSFKMAAIRQRLIQSIGNFDWGLFLRSYQDKFNRPITTSIERQMNEQQFALELMQLYGSGVDVYCDLLEKMLINFNQFKSSLFHNHRMIQDALMFRGLLNYGLAIIAIYFYRKLEGFVVAPVALIVVAHVAMNFGIAIASDIHSTLKKLQPLIWTLIGQNMEAKDVKIQALRELWLRQMIFIENSGGLGYRFMGSLITYMGIIKMMLWTSTILTVITK